MLTHTTVCLEASTPGNRSWWVDRPHATQGKASVETSHFNSDESQQTSQRRRTAGNGIRSELVARVRREIAEGTYLTEAKWEVALERLFDRLDQE